MSVVYAPEDPEKADLKSFTNLWVMPVVLALFSSVFLGGSLNAFIHLLFVDTAAASTLPAPAARLEAGSNAVVVDHSPASTRIYIGSPSIAILPNGAYVASHDYFGPGSSSDTTLVFDSNDRGLTWRRLATLKGQWWSTLFVHQGRLYLMGTSRQNGKVVIRRSDDGGRNWTTPADATSGLLLSQAQYACAPGAVVVHGGRIWRAMEECTRMTGGKHYRVFMMSALAEADLLKASNWTASNPISSNPDWLGGEFGGWLEGNAVVAPDDQMVNILRVHYTIGTEKAALVHVSPDGRAATFDPTRDLVEFPGGSKKFTIRFDPVSRLYWALVNPVPASAAGGHDHIRNTLALTSSPDLTNWTTRSIILHHPDTKKHGFQYADWQFDGADIIAVVRTATDDQSGGAHSFHDANYLTFHRIKGFRELPQSAAAPLLPEATADAPGFTVSGRDFTLAPLRNGALAFRNRKYVWQEVPAGLSGRRYTQTAGGVKAHVRIHATHAALLQAVTALEQPGLNLDGWEPTSTGFYYTDEHHTRMTLLQRKLNPGDDLDIPQGNWSGVLILLPD